MTSAARRVWDGYVGQLAGTLRLVDGFALRRLCEDVAQLEELQVGMRKMAGDMKRQARLDEERLQELQGEAGAAAEVERSELRGRRLSGGAMVSLAKTPEGRRIAATISSLASRIQRQELQFGLTPASAGRVPEGAGGPLLPQDDLEEALCG